MSMPHTTGYLSKDFIARYLLGWRHVVGGLSRYYPSYRRFPVSPRLWLATQPGCLETVCAHLSALHRSLSWLCLLERGTGWAKMGGGGGGGGGRSRGYLGIVNVLLHPAPDLLGVADIPQVQEAHLNTGQIRRGG